MSMNKINETKKYDYEIFINNAMDIISFEAICKIH